MRFSKLLSVAAVTAMLIPAAGNAAEMTLRLHTLVKSPHPYNDMAAFMADEVAARSDGMIEIKIFDSGQLGQDTAVIGEMGLGTIDLMISSTSNAVQQVPEYQIFSVPYLFSGFDDLMERVKPGSPGASYFQERYDEYALGMQLLAIGASGSRNMSNALGPVEGLSDIVGIKMRTPPSPMMSKTWAALGTLPVSVAWGELYAAVQTGVAEGLESSIAGYTGSKLYEVAPYLALTAHEVQVNHLSMSDRAWNKLSEEQQAMMLEVAAEAALLGVEMARKYDDELVTTLQTEHEVTVTTPDVAAFKEKLRPVQSELIKEFELQPALNALTGSL